MKVSAITLGILLLAPGTSSWAQALPDVVAARQEADFAQEQAQRKLQEAIKLQALQAGARATGNGTATAPVPRATITLPQTRFGTYSPGYGNTGNNLLSTTRSDNPLSSLQVAPGTWWNNPDKAKLLNLTKDQQKKMDDIFQQYRLKLIDLNAALSKEEAILDPLLASEKLDEAKIVVQIDRIAQARSELEKANSRLLLGIRQSLTMEQWTQVQAPANSQVLRR